MVIDLNLHSYLKNRLVSFTDTEQGPSIRIFEAKQTRMGFGHTDKFGKLFRLSAKIYIILYIHIFEYTIFFYIFAKNY